jgi:hypothetical protein
MPEFIEIGFQFQPKEQISALGSGDMLSCGRSSHRSRLG